MNSLTYLVYDVTEYCNAWESRRDARILARVLETRLLLSARTDGMIGKCLVQDLSWARSHVISTPALSFQPLGRSYPGRLSLKEEPSRQ